MIYFASDLFGLVGFGYVWLCFAGLQFSKTGLTSFQK